MFNVWPGRVPIHVVSRIAGTGTILDDHVIRLQTESPSLDSQRRPCLLPDGLKRFVIADDCEPKYTLDEPIEVLTRPDYR